MEDTKTVSRNPPAFSPWFPYVVSACLMIMGVGQTVEVFRLDAAIRSLETQLDSTQDDASRLRASNTMTGLRLTTLEAKEPEYATARLLVAWDPYRHQGVITFDGLPPTPAGQAYQVWVLDPNAAAPLSAGFLTNGRPFSVPAVSVMNPGFILTLEPIKGSSEPTSAILFAVAPGS